ncbi:uncharacterized protein Dere_GG23314, isoform B [Drosophila erecta]|uniref:Uncharacterized protein, isoform B n=1 Tax=Drosophila erecta TaxID=7220 RepID=A0A0Q5WC73_DROER|nr:uncharacterized protein Dere_GG23314, isoform B [Drosophila erecta]
MDSPKGETGFLDKVSLYETLTITQQFHCQRLLQKTSPNPQILI